MRKLYMFVVKKRVMLLMSFLTSHILLNVGFKVARQILIDTGDLSLDSPERQETLWGWGTPIALPISVTNTQKSRASVSLGLNFLFCLLGTRARDCQAGISSYSFQMSHSNTQNSLFFPSLHFRTLRKVFVF